MALLSISSSFLITASRANDGQSHNAVIVSWITSAGSGTFIYLNNAPSTQATWTYQYTGSIPAGPIQFSVTYRNIGGIVNNHETSDRITWISPNTLSLVPARTPIDSAAYIGKSNTNVPLVHFAAEGTALSTLKADTPSSGSYFHSSLLPVCATTVYEYDDIVGNKLVLPASVARYLDTVVFLCTAYEVHTGRWIAMNMRFPIGTAGYWGNSLLFKAGSSPYTHNEWIIGHTDTLQFPFTEQTGFSRGFTRCRIYPLNLDIVSKEVRYKDFSVAANPSGVQIRGVGFYINKLRIDSLMPLASVGTNMILPNYSDHVYPTAGAVREVPGYKPAYDNLYGTESCIQVLGSMTRNFTPSWEIDPNKGIMKKNGIIWWDAAFGRTRMNLNPYLHKQSMRKMETSYSWPAAGGIGNYETNYDLPSYAVLPSQLNYVAGTTYGVCAFLTGTNTTGLTTANANAISLLGKGGEVTVGYQTHSVEKTELYYVGTNTSPYTRILWKMSVYVTTKAYVAADNTVRIKASVRITTYRYPERSADYPGTVSTPAEYANFSVFQIY